MPRIKLAASCKVNLHLSVGDRREDGYHNLESIFQALEFGDTLDFETGEENGVCEILTRSPLPQGGFQVPVEENIVYKAVSLFRTRTGFNRGVKVLLEKRIPLGGGLGGGSSDAAAALTALDMLAGTGLSPAELRDMALCLGSDVPFFLGPGGTAWVSGRGERLFPLDPPLGAGGPLAVVLVNPGFPSPTGEAFRRLDCWRSSAWRGNAWRSSALRGGVLRDVDREGLIKALNAGPRDWPFWNDFLPALSGGDGEEAAAYIRVLSALREGGAEFCSLSGAGSTCFGVFNDGGTAETVAKLLLSEGFFVQVTFFLACSSIRVLEW